MCESQMSLCAREKLLRKESAMSRSREKLYGLKSLSKSQEVLSFYKSVLNLHDDIFKTTKDKKVGDPTKKLEYINYPCRCITHRLRVGILEISDLVTCHTSKNCEYGFEKETFSGTALLSCTKYSLFPRTP